MADNADCFDQKIIRAGFKTIRRNGCAFSSVRLSLRMFMYLSVFFMVFMVSPSIAANDSNAEKKALDVADVISMRRLIDLENYAYATPQGEKFSIAPDRQFFFTISRKGDVASDKNIFELNLFNVDEVIDYLNDSRGREMPKSTTLVRLTTQSNLTWVRQYAIRAARWSPDSKSIFYIGDTGVAPGQVYKVDIDSGAKEQLSFHLRTVYDYDVDHELRSLVYSSTLPNLDKERNKTSFTVHNRRADELINIEKESPFLFQYQYFFRDLADGDAAPRPLGEAHLVRQYSLLRRTIWLSPNGKNAVVRVPFRGEEEHEVYRKYLPFYNTPYFRDQLTHFDEYTMSYTPGVLSRYILVDTENGSADDVFGDAPAGSFVSASVEKVAWSENGRSVVFPPTFLPDTDVSRDEWNERRAKPYVVSYDFASTRMAKITDMPLLEPDVEQLFDKSSLGIPMTALSMIDMWFDDNYHLFLKFRDRTSGEHVVETFEFRGGEWVKAEENSDDDDDERIERLQLSLQESLNTPPDILATDMITGAERLISDLNPQFESLKFGHVSYFDWTDVEERQWRGLLIFPPDYKSDHRYPLVIQTKGFDPEKFFIDGRDPISPFAAQALANKGMIVLQMPLGVTSVLDASELREVMLTPDELRIHRLGVESAIDALDSRKFIDRSKVGMVGFSRSCLYLDHMLLFSEYKIAAAVRTDGIALSLLNYVNQFGASQGGMATIEKMLGRDVGDVTGVVDATGLTTRNLHRMRTPLRMELYLSGMNYHGNYWDFYVLLRRLQKPVEMVLYPDTHHLNINPKAQMDSSGGVVDWFSFWLLNDEDRNPLKAKRYSDWRALKEKHLRLDATSAITAPKLNQNTEVGKPVGEVLQP